MYNDTTVFSKENETQAVTVEFDLYPESPRSLYDNESVIATWHKDYIIGDDVGFNSPVDFLMDLVLEYTKYSIEDIEYLDREPPVKAIGELLELLEENKNLIMLPIYLLDHSGISISTRPFTCQWDSGQIGWAYGYKMEQEIIDKEVKELDTYIRGDLYVVTFYDKKECPTCGHIHYEVTESHGDVMFEDYEDMIELLIFELQGTPLAEDLKWEKLGIKD